MLTSMVFYLWGTLRKARSLASTAVAGNKKGMKRTAVPETSTTREQLRSKIRQSEEV